LLLLAAAKQTGLLAALVAAIMEVADPTIPGLNPPNPAVVMRLILTLLFLPVAGLARTWDLRSYTGTTLALVTGRERAFSQRYTERFLARLAHAGGAERLTEVVAKWTWELWETARPSSDQPTVPAFFYVDGHRKAVYSDVLVPRGPVGKLGGKILGCRELVVLHDAQGHPLLATTHRGDYHLTIGLPEMLRRYEQATGQTLMQRVVVDREGMAAEFLAQLQQEGRQVVTLLRSDQYEDEQSFQQVGEWQPWRSNRHGQVICEVAAARFALKRPDNASPPLEVEVALIPAVLEPPYPDSEYRRVFAAMAQDRPDALLVAQAVWNYAHQKVIVELAKDARLPAIYPGRSFVDQGGLMSYGADLTEIFRRAGSDVAQILGGAKPGDIPYYQASHFQLIINLKTAKTLGLTLPQSLFARADEVIE